MTGTRPIDTTITLVSSEKSPKLIARVFSTSPPLDPEVMSVWKKTIFLGSWWWVGLATFPRTVVQAYKLVVNRGLSWVTRPEPKAVSISRHTDRYETLIEGIFRQYLQQVIGHVDEALVVKYTPAGTGIDEEEVFMSASAQLSSSSTNDTIEFKTERVLEIKVLTPAFYSNLIHYTDTTFATTLLSEHECSTIYLSNFKLTSVLSPSSTQVNQIVTPKKPGPFESLQWKLLHQLRPRCTPPTASTHPSPSPSPSPFLSSMAGYKGTDLETFILTHCPPHTRVAYLSQALKLLISEHIALGSVEILDLEIFALKCLGLWVLAGSML